MSSTSSEVFAVDQFHLEGVEKALGAGIIIAAAFAAHAAH